MNKNMILLALGLILVISACSEKIGDEQKTSDETAINTPSIGTELPQQVASGTVPEKGKVLQTMHAGGYTYMKVENNGNQFWIAATMLNVRRNDEITWTQASLMKDFTSSSLRKTFKEILFVSTVLVTNK